MIVRSISGLRFTLDELSCAFVQNYAAAFHQYLPAGKIIIGRDGRPSGKQIEKLISNMLASLGRNVEIIGIAPTPTVQLYTETQDAAGGICITASHNPTEWNGLKFLNANGLFLNESQNQKMWSFLKPITDDNLAQTKNETPPGKIDFPKDAIKLHINKIMQIPFVKNELHSVKNFLQRNNIHFVIDAINASGSAAIADLLDVFDAKYEKLFCDETGVFPHPPEPLPQNLTALCSFLKAQSAADPNVNYIGVAVDPDADRLVLIGEDGKCIGEELTICLAIDSYFTFNNSGGPAVVNQSTTMLADAIAAKHKVKIERAAVGEINAVQKMQATGAPIGGEGSGGVILPACHYGRDSMVGLTLILMLLAKCNKTLAQYVGTYPQYFMRKTKQSFSGDWQLLADSIEKAYSNEEVSLIDGIKVGFADGWVHIRPSNTEPVLRIISEAETEARAEELVLCFAHLL